MKQIFFKNKEEHWRWCYQNYFKHYNRFDAEGNYIEPSVWEPEDLKIMQPFFDWSKRQSTALGSTKFEPASEEVKKGLEYYAKIKDAGTDARERIDVTTSLDSSQLLEIFGFKSSGCDRYLAEDDFDEGEEEIQRFSETSCPDPLDHVIYPCVMVAHLEKEWDRGGSMVVTVVDFVDINKFSKYNN